VTKLIAVRGAPTLQGTIRLSPGNSVLPGQEVELRSGATVLRTATSDGSGAWRMDGVAAATYELRLQPQDQYQCLTPVLGSVPGQEGRVSVVVETGAPPTPIDFTVEVATFFDGFQSWANSAALVDLVTGFGASATTTPGMSGGTGGSAGLISLTNEGPSGEKVMRYDWPDRIAVGCVSDGFNVSRRVHFGTKPNSPFLCIRWFDQYLTGWVNGLAQCGTIEYKTMLNFIDLAAGGTQIWEALHYGAMPGQMNMGLHAWSNAQDSPTTRWPVPANMVGGWHSWMLVVRGLNTLSAVGELWYDGALVNTVVPKTYTQQAPWYPPFNAVLPGTTRLNFVNVGANINTGSPAMAKLWRAFGIYTKRCREKGSLL
jgi:hypothetical protein